MTLRFHPAAQDEFIESTLYYEAARPGLGQQFRDAVRVGLDRIVVHPEIGATRRGAAEGRCWLMDFPTTLSIASRTRISKCSHWPIIAGALAIGDVECDRVSA